MYITLQAACQSLKGSSPSGWGSSGTWPGRILRKITIMSSMPHYVHHLTGGDPPVVQEPLGWERSGRTYSHRTSGFTQHGGRQRSEILGIRLSVRQRSVRSSLPRRRYYSPTVLDHYCRLHTSHYSYLALIIIIFITLFNTLNCSYCYNIALINMSMNVNIVYIQLTLSPWPWFNLHPTGCIGPDFDAILICFELPPPLPPSCWFPSLTSPCWLCSSSLYADDLTSLKPQNLPVQRLSRYVLVIHSYHVIKPAESYFT